MPTIKKSNIFNYIKSKFSSTSSDIKMNGTQSAGSADRIARADHVHPVDTSRAAANHTHTKSNITDFPSSMNPTSHAHGDISNTGTIGSAANKPLITGSNGKIIAGNFGTGANTFCEGNDSRLTNSRTPTSHTHGDISNTGTIGNASGKIITTGNGGVLQASNSITKSMISDFIHTHNYDDNTIINIDISNNVSNFLSLNFATGIGVYSKWAGTASISSANTWENYVNLNNLLHQKSILNNNQIFMALGANWTNNILIGDGLMYAKVEGDTVSYFSQVAGSVVHQPYSIPFMFVINDTSQE